MKKISKENFIILIALVLILILQTIAIVYATNERKGYHIDELYSHGLMQYENAFIFDNDDFLNEWHDSDYFKDYLTINEDEMWDFSAVYKNQINDVHPPLYYLLLRLVCTFNVGEFSIWPGTILNIIIFIFSSIMLYLIGKKVFENKYYAILLCLLNGFSLASIETVMYVRMYQLLILNILILIYWHIVKSNKQELNIKDLLPLYIMVIIGFLTHYYYAIIAVILYIMYITKYIKMKKYKNAMNYTLILGASALTSLLIFPYAIIHIFFGYRGREVIENSTHIFSILHSLTENAKIINKELFNGYMHIIVGIIAILSICMLIIKIKKHKKEAKQIDKSETINYVAIPMIVYLFIAITVSPYNDLRYIMPAIPILFCSLLYFMRYILQNIVTKRNAFIIILIMTILFSVTTIPKLSDNSYSYKKYEKVTKYIEDNLSDNSWIYIYKDVPIQENKMMVIYPALLTAKETYIIKDKDVCVEEIKKALSGKDLSSGIILVMDYNQQDEMLECAMETGLFKEYKWKCGFGMYKIFLLK